MKSSISIFFALLLLLNPSFAFCRDEYKEARTLFDKQSYKTALESFLKIKLEGEREADRLYYCALCYLKLGKEEEGSKIFRQITERFPRSRAATLSLSYLQAIPAGGNESIRKSDFPEEISVPFRKTAKGQITVTASIQGKSMEMIFDTGAEECLLGKNQVAAANLNDADRSKGAILHSVSGPMHVYQILAEVKLSGLTRKLPVCVQDLDMDSGILGQPFLKGYSCSIDNQAGLIRLRKDSKKNSAVALDSFAVPFKETGDKLIVSARINGRATEMCFDTGAFGVCLSKSQAEKLELKLPDSIPDRKAGPNGLSVPSWEIKAGVELGPIKKTCPVRVMESEISYPLLGQNFFGDRSFYIDRASHEIRFAR